MKAVLMAGGEGTRLRPLTCERPKPMVPIANRPVMEHILTLLTENGFTEIIITLRYLAQSVQDYFGDGTDFGVHITYSVEDTPLGTAGSVRQIQRFLDDTFLIISGDTLTDIDLAKMVEFHRRNQAAVTIALTRVENPLEYGVVITDAEGRIQRFLEKPGWGQVFSDTINTGIYVLEPDVLNYLDPGQAYDFSKDLFPLLLRRKAPLYGYKATGYWCDVGNLGQYLQANQDALTGKVRVHLAGNQLAPGIWVGDGTEVDRDARLVPPVLLGRGCSIRAGAVLGEGTVVGDYATIDRQASVKRSVVGVNCYLGPRVQVRGALIARDSVLMADSAAFEDAVIGDRCQLREGSQVRPGHKLWPNKVIEPGTVVSSSIIWGARWGRSLFGDSQVRGLVNVDITPEVAARLGAAFASTLPKGAGIVVARDGFRSSRLLKRALISGIMSSGCTVQDLHYAPAGLVRFAIGSAGAAGGVHVRACPEDERLSSLVFFDYRGHEIGQGDERKIENAFFREDVRKVSVEGLGEVEYPTGVGVAYADTLLAQLPAEKIRQRRWRVVLAAADGIIPEELPLLLDRLGCRVSALSRRPVQEATLPGDEDPSQMRRDLAATVAGIGADLGVFLDDGGDRAWLVDESGAQADFSHLLVALALHSWQRTPGSTVAVPVDASAQLEELARRTGGQVARCKAERSALVSARPAVLAGNNQGYLCVPELAPGFDGVAAFISLLTCLSEEGASFGQMLARVARPALVRTQAECPWEWRGRLMRELLEVTEGFPTELTDGIKVYHDDTWVLILPDPSRPVFSVTAEGPQAQALSARYQALLLEKSRLYQAEKAHHAAS